MLLGKSEFVMGGKCYSARTRWHPKMQFILLASGKAWLLDCLIVERSDPSLARVNNAVQLTLCKDECMFGSRLAFI